jgi:hemerythrin-like domain-containing protein
MENDRRRFLAASAALGISTIVSSGNVLRDETAKDKKSDEEEGISAPEDLMREHGVLNRILLIYEEGLRRLQAKQDVPPEVFHKPAALVRSFVEDYHEKLEETFIFPAFEKRNKLVELVTVLRQQHAAGRKVTDVVLQNAIGEQFHKADSRKRVIQSCGAFIRMYRPHETREDTVLFPALYKMIGAKEVKNLGEQFEEKEHKLFGEDGFEKAVDEVASIEKQLGIYDLASFTPK